MSRVWRFLAWTFAIDWGGLALFLLLGGEWNTAGSTLFALAYMFVPLIAAGLFGGGWEVVAQSKLTSASPVINIQMVV